LALLAGFALDQTAAGRAFGEAIALAIAVLARAGLGLLGLDLLRSGVEVRGLTGNWAIRVSEVCDGIGLVIALLSAQLALTPRSGSWTGFLWRATWGFGALQAFNLLRVMALAYSLSRGGTGFGLWHDAVFPFLSLAVIGALVLPWRVATGLIVLALPLAAVWHLAAPHLAPLLVPPANLVLTLAPQGVGALTPKPPGWAVESLFVAQTTPLRLYIAPITPSDFTLALPVLLAASLIARQVWGLGLGLIGMLLALSLAAITAALSLAAAHAPALVLLPDGTGAFTLAPYTLPETLLDGLRIWQNTLVHFNLLVLPLLILGHEGRDRDTV
jgi:exosortase/archaeosortase family protein